MLLSKPFHILFILCCIPWDWNPVLAQPLGVPEGLDHFTNSDGLSQGMINAIEQDQAGFLWFGTKDGLNRYDGYQFRVYRNDPFDTTSLSSDFIETIFEDYLGTLWIGTDEGLNRFNSSSGGFMRLKHNPTSKLSLTSNGITKIVESAQVAGRDFRTIWVGTNDGLNRLTIQYPQKANDALFEISAIDRFFHEMAISDSAIDTYIRDLALDRWGNLWVSTSSGIFLADKDSIQEDDFEFKKVTITQKGRNLEKYQFTYFARFLKGRNGDLWIGTRNGLFKLKEAALENIDFHHFLFPDWVSGSGIRTMTFDQNNRVWFITNDNVASILNPETSKFEPLENKFSKKIHALNPITSILFSDWSNNIWFGTFGFGIYKYNLKKEQFHVATKSNVVKDPPRTSYVSAFEALQERDEMLVNMERFYIYDLKNHKLNTTSFALANDPDVELRGLPSGKFFIHKKKDKEYFLYNPSNGDYQLLKRAPSNRALVFQSVLEYGDGGIYFIEFEFGKAHDEGDFYLTTWDDKNGLISEFMLPTDTRRSLSRFFERGLLDRHGKIWLPNREGLVTIDPVQKKMKVFRYDREDPKSLNKNFIKAICADPLMPERYLWVGTSGGGLNRMDKLKETFTHLVEKDGLPNNVVYGILPDNHNNLWISTNIGLCKVELDQNRDAIFFQNFDLHDGLPGNEFNTNAYFKNKRGELFFGGVDGFTWFHPDSLLINPKPPSIVITDVFVNYQSISYQGTRAHAQGAGEKSIVLSYQQNAVTFEFAALDFSSPSKNRYAYKLEHFDKDWKQAGDNRRAVYTNLDPGNYTFKVRASNSDGIWNYEGAQLLLQIQYPWWKTWWAFLIFASTIFLGIWRIRQFMLDRRRLEREAEVERARAEEKRRQAEKVEAQSKELEAAFEELKQKNQEIITAQQKLIMQDKLATLGQLIAGIAHEIKNPLNFVNNFSEISIELADELEEEFEKYHDKFNGEDLMGIKEIISDIRQNAVDIHSNGQRANSIIRNMMDHSRGSEDDRRLVDINALLEENVKLAYHGYRAMDITFNVIIKKQLDDSLPKVSVISHDLGRVLLNILNNACYALHQKQQQLSNSFDPILKVSTLQEDDQIIVRIRDNGPGIPLEVREKIFQPFFTTKPAGEGNTGLGLAISQKIIVEKHNGTLEVESESGQFTEFIIGLPMKV